MARPGTGGGSSGGGFSGSRSSGSSSGGRSSGGSRPTGGGSFSSGRSSSGGSSSSGRSSSSGGSSFFGSSSSSPKKYTTSSSSSSGNTQSTRNSGGRPAGGSASQNNNNRQNYHGGFGGMAPGHRDYGRYGHHYGFPHRRPRLFRRLFYRRGYGDYYYQNNNYANTGFGCGCLFFFMIPVLAILAVAIILAVTGYNSSGTSETKTAQFSEAATESSNGQNKPEAIRIPLSPDKVIETDYYLDDLGWIEEPEILLAGLKEFYSETGVQPYLRLIAPVSNTNTNEECDSYANGLYDELFGDEGHFLLVYVENLDPEELGYLAYVCGSDAVAVMDDPAVDILYQYIDHYWFNEEYTTEEVFSNAFRDTANDIMVQSHISGSWTNSKNGWQFTDDNGEVLRDTWAEIDESRYYFTSDGYMATGWIKNNGKWYYADENGGLATGWVEINDKWYYLDVNGACLTDTTTPDGYYVDENGVRTQ